MISPTSLEQLLVISSVRTLFQFVSGAYNKEEISNEIRITKINSIVK
jgi:hypothetical protein